MREEKSLGLLEKRILLILSRYLRLTPLQLWYELEEASNVAKRASTEDIRRSLEFLQEKGLVEREGKHWLLNQADNVVLSGSRM